jgi:hypothetical protein
LDIAERARPRKRGQAGAVGIVQLDVPLQAEESAVILLEDEGEYRWIVDGQEIAHRARPVRRARRGGAVVEAPPEQRQMRFKLKLTAAQPGDEKPAGRKKRGVLARTVWGKARAYIFKFAVRLAGNQIIRLLERKVKQGLVAINSLDPKAWVRLDNTESLPQRLPTGRRPRVLLMVHGTFSSTIGSFGALGSSEWGREFLRRAFSAYDAILGFDHPTLSVDPQVNAVDMLTRLEAIDWPESPDMDLIAFSRGGLVARSLIEQLLPASSWKPRIQKVIFVGCTNEGTNLAEPDNWHRLVDRYTNLAIWGTRALSLIPGAQSVAVIVGEAIQGVATLVKVLATHAVTDKGVPGLAAMEPDGEFVTTINQTQPGQPSPPEVFYCAVTSNFEPGRALEDGTTPDLPPKLLMRLGDKTIDDLFGEANDLVVNTRSMTAIDPQVGGFINDKLDFGTNGLVYHTIYFTRRETVSALARWLGLDSAAAAIPEKRTKRGKRATGSVALEPRPARVRPGAVVGSSASPIARSNILVVNAAQPTGTVLRAARAGMPDYVVVAREYQDSDLYYAYSPEELRKITKGVPARISLQESLNLHETDASMAKPDAPGVGMIQGEDPLRPAASRTVVLGGGDPVGVVPSVSDLPIQEEQQQMMVDEMEAAAPEMERPMRRRAVRRAGARRKVTSKKAAKKQVAHRGPAPAEAVEADQVDCQFRAEMDEEVVAGQTTDVEVTISREMLGEAIRGLSDSGKAAVSRRKKLIIQIAERRNFRVEGERRLTVKVPEPGEPVVRYFDVVGLMPGEEGELWVQIRQGSVPLVTFKLFPKIVTQRLGAARRSRAAAYLEALPPTERPLDELIINEDFVGDQVQYKFFLSLPSLKIREHFESQPLPGARDEYITQIMNEIGDSWAGAGPGGLKAFERSLKAIGGKMFDQLIPRDMQQLLWDNRQRIRSIQVFSMEPFIPWELIYLKEPGRRLLPKESQFLGELGLVRWLYEGYPPKELHLRKGKARYVVPDYPPSLALANAQLEADMVKRLFGAKAVNPNLNDIETLLETPGAFDLLHFAGHGEAAGSELTHARLLVNGDLDTAGRFVGDALSATTVEQTAQLRANGGPIVVLNACESARRNREFSGMGGFADAFVRAGAGVFVGTHWSVGDEPARAFIEAFYEAFMLPANRARPVKLSVAVTRARKAARKAGDATWLAYVIYGHPHAVLKTDKAMGDA